MHDGRLGLLDCRAAGFTPTRGALLKSIHRDATCWIVIAIDQFAAIELLGMEDPVLKDGVIANAGAGLLDGLIAVATVAVLQSVEREDVMAESQSSFDDSYNSDDDNDNDEQSSESPGLVLDGPYAHIFLANFQRDLQQSVNAGKKAFKKNKNMNHKSSLNEIEEPPKHEPPANPLPAENLNPCIKSSSGKKKSKLGITPHKMTWAADVYDPTPSVEALDLSDTIEWPKGDNKYTISSPHTREIWLENPRNLLLYETIKRFNKTK
ncbi:hypothetical protein BUALT_Bualt02G0021100 [Buddleja alternifolia]|uniref:Uncharacterized protein n=1 Tax=Buddleja alternifolia TaxID=168488 RepID=A0AAV6Y7Y6_9LAMI|nr:hypothetical protein BUALT_Bualt02G0021100 [Buddleja alternifolia]